MNYFYEFTSTFLVGSVVASPQQSTHNLCKNIATVHYLSLWLQGFTIRAKGQRHGNGSGNKEINCQKLSLFCMQVFDWEIIITRVKGFFSETRKQVSNNKERQKSNTIRRKLVKSTQD